MSRPARQSIAVRAPPLRPGCPREHSRCFCVDCPTSCATLTSQRGARVTPAMPEFRALAAARRNFVVPRVGAAPRPPKPSPARTGVVEDGQGPPRNGASKARVLDDDEQPPPSCARCPSPNSAGRRASGATAGGDGRIDAGRFRARRCAGRPDDADRSRERSRSFTDRRRATSDRAAMTSTASCTLGVMSKPGRGGARLMWWGRMP